MIEIQKERRRPKPKERRERERYTTVKESCRRSSMAVCPDSGNGEREAEAMKVLAS